MTRLQERTASMFLTNVDYLNNHSTITSTIGGYANFFNPYTATVDAIDTHRLAQILADTRSNTASKKQFRDDAMAAYKQVAIALRAYAAFIKHPSLKASAPNSFADFSRLADTEFAKQCETLYNIALPYSALLVNHDLDANGLPDFLTAITAYKNEISIPRQTLMERVDSTKELKRLFAVAKEQLAELAEIVATKQFKEPAFYRKFVESMKIVDNTSRSLALRCSVKTQDGIGLDGFKLSFIENTTAKSYEYSTSAKGNMQRANFKAGIYNITISKSGFTPLSGNITIVNGETYDLKVIVDFNTKQVLSGTNTVTSETF